MKSKEEKIKDVEEYFRITGNPEAVFPGSSQKEKAVSKEFRAEIAKAVGGELPDGTTILDGYLSGIEIPDRMDEIRKIINAYAEKLKSE